MKHRKWKPGALLLLLGLGFISLNAQNKLYFRGNDGAQTTLELSSIRKLTFEAGNVNVTKTDGNTESYLLSSLRYFNFTDLSTGILPLAKTMQSGTFITPNPAKEQLKINFQANQNGILHVAIIGMHGRIVLQEKMAMQQGTMLTPISIANLPKGIYVCRLQYGSKIENIKFIKN